MSNATDKRCLSSSDTTQTSHASPPKKVKHGEDVSSSEEDCSRSKWSTSSQDGHGIKENFPSADVNFTDEETQSQDGAKFAVVTDRTDKSGSKGMDIEQSLRVIGDSSSQDSKAETLGACSTSLDKKSDKETCCEFQNKVQDKGIVTDKAKCCHLTDISKTWTSVQQPQNIPDQVRDAHDSGKISGGQVGSNNDIKISSPTKESDVERNLNFKNNDVPFEQERTAEASDLRASENSQTGTCVKEIEDFEESFGSHYSSVYTTTSSDYTDSSDDDLVIDLDDDDDDDRRKGDEDALHEMQPNRRQDLQCGSGTSKSSEPVGYTAAKLLKLPMKSTDPDEIDAFQREKYVMFLMQTLKSNVFYDSFCYAFPKRKQIEDSFKYKVKSISDFMEGLQNKELSFIPNADFPTSASLYQAEGFIEDMKKRYVKVGEDAGIEKCEEEEENNAKPDDDQRQTQGCPASQCTEFDTLTGCPDQEGNPATGSSVCGKTEPRDDTSGTCSNSGGKSGTTETSGDSSESSTSKDMTKALEKEMDNDVPHHTVFVVGGQNGCVKSSWAGQFLLTVNPVTNSLLMKLFTYAPDYDEEVCQSFANGKFTEKVWHEMKKNLHLFELSRQLCVNVALDSIASVKMMVSESDDSEGVIWLHCKATPTFHQRFIHTTASLLNQWQPRESFWSDVATGDPPYDLCLGGTTEELSAIMALIVTCEPRLKGNTDTETSEYSYSQTCSELRKCDGNEMFHNEIHDSQARMQRSEILRILLDHQLISQNHYKEMLEDKPPRENKDIHVIENREINILEGLSDFHECFSDYISFHCADVFELENHLSAPLNASAYGFSPEQFDFNCTMAEQDKCNTTTDGTSSTEGNSRASPVDKLPDIETMKVADFLRLQKSPSVFYSFCTGCLQEDSHTWHCGVCRKCVSWRTWHCVRCNNCSRGTSDSVCEFCGSYGFDRTIIRPLSMFAEELWDDQCSPTNQRWNITVSKDDIIHWPDPCKDLDQTADHPDIPFRLKEMMSDHLGLIDPVAFLLGTSARGIESRHERIRLKYKKKEKPTAQLPCVIQ